MTESYDPYANAIAERVNALFGIGSACVVLEQKLRLLTIDPSVLYPVLILFMFLQGWALLFTPLISQFMGNEGLV